MDDYRKLMIDRPELFCNSGAGIYIYTDEGKIKEIQEQCVMDIGIMYQDDYIMLVRDAVCHPNGQDGTYIRIVYMARGFGVVLLPLLKVGKTVCIFLLSHYRHAMRKEYLELPRGFAENGVDNVRKELLEELGYGIKKMHYLGMVAPDTGMIAGEAQVYAVFVNDNICYPTDDKESINDITVIDYERLKERIAKGDIIDGYTLSAFALGDAKKIFKAD